MKLPVPVNIVTGALGVGKTTAIQHLLSLKPVNECWAVLVNEFGALGIDGALLAGSPDAPKGGVVVKELAGGCLCCTLSGPLGASLAQLIRQAKPDRLIIEPSGLGHPAGLLDVLDNPHLRTAVDVRAVICLVDVQHVHTPCFARNETAQDQVNISDVLVGHKAELASPDQLEAFHQWAEELFPPKAQVVVTSHGQLAWALLEVPRTVALAPVVWKRHHTAPSGSFGEPATAVGATATAVGAGRTAAAAATSAPQQEQQLPGRRRPLRFEAQPSPEYRSCGWLFSREDVFHKGRLLELLTALTPAVARVKGVFRVGPTSWVTPAAAAPTPRSLHSPPTTVTDLSTHGACETALVLVPFAYRRDSRLEVIISCGHLRGTATSQEQREAGGILPFHGGVAAQQHPAKDCGHSTHTGPLCYEQGINHSRSDNAVLTRVSGVGQPAVHDRTLPVAVDTLPEFLASICTGTDVAEEMSANGPGMVEAQDGTRAAGQVGMVSAALDAASRGDWAVLEGYLVSLLMP